MHTYIMSKANNSITLRHHCKSLALDPSSHYDMNGPVNPFSFVLLTASLIVFGLFILHLPLQKPPTHTHTHAHEPMTFQHSLVFVWIFSAFLKLCILTQAFFLLLLFFSWAHLSQPPLTLLTIFLPTHPALRHSELGCCKTEENVIRKTFEVQTLRRERWKSVEPVAVMAIEWRVVMWGGGLHYGVCVMMPVTVIYSVNTALFKPGWLLLFPAFMKRVMGSVVSEGLKLLGRIHRASSGFGKAHFSIFKQWDGTGWITTLLLKLTPQWEMPHPIRNSRPSAKKLLSKTQSSSHTHTPTLAQTLLESSAKQHDVQLTRSEQRWHPLWSASREITMHWQKKYLPVNFLYGLWCDSTVRLPELKAAGEKRKRRNKGRGVTV